MKKRFETRVTVFSPLRTRDYRPNSFVMSGAATIKRTAGIVLPHRRWRDGKAGFPF